MNRELSNIIKKMSGKVLAIGLDESKVKYLEKNDNIDCILLDSVGTKTKTKGKRNKKIKIKKIRKVFKKKKIDYIICNYEQISRYLNTFVKDSVYINKGKLYFYNVDDIELIKKRYERYNTKITIKNSVIEIDNSLSKNNFIKDSYYRIIDFVTKIIEVIGDLLMG